MFISTNINIVRTTGVGAQSTSGGHDIFARKICMKNYQNTRIFMIFAGQINKIPEFYVISAQKCPNFT